MMKNFYLGTMNGELGSSVTQKSFFDRYFFFARSLWFRGIVGFCIGLFLIANYRVVALSSDKVTSDIDKLSPRGTALLLGTSRTLKNGSGNAYFALRVDACARLYFSGKIKRILVSGDNSVQSYNEPQDMKDALIAAGVPAEKIFLDHAGFDTYDSVLRAREVFGQTSFIVVSQQFQNERAVYIARRNGIDAVGFNAQDVRKLRGLKTRIREYFARVKAYVEVNLGIDPYFLGERITIS
ncbi:MAG: vancomycin high temperature exclusion protein [Bacteroidota bacterium]|jgi:SanA protein